MCLNWSRWLLPILRTYCRSVNYWAYQYNLWINVLQTAIPVFDGLFPEPFNTSVSALLYHACTCHALSKLRMHTDGTIEHLRISLQQFGDCMRQIERKLYSLPSTKKQAKGKNKPCDSRPATLNCNTIKFHSLGDYPRTILRLGSTDSYLTYLVRTAYIVTVARNQIWSSKGESEHKKSKESFNRTNKSAVTKGLANIDQIRTMLRKIDVRVKRMESDGDNLLLSKARIVNDNAPQTNGNSKSLKAPYKIPKYGQKFHIGSWLRQHRHDLAIKVSVFSLHMHDYCYLHWMVYPGLL